MKSAPLARIFRGVQKNCGIEILSLSITDILCTRRHVEWAAMEGGDEAIAELGDAIRANRGLTSITVSLLTGITTTPHCRISKIVPGPLRVTQKHQLAAGHRLVHRPLQISRVGGGRRAF